MNINHLRSLHKNTIETMTRSLNQLKDELKDIAVCERAALRTIKLLTKTGSDPLALAETKKHLKSMERDWENTSDAILYLHGAIQQVRNGREYLNLAVAHRARVA